MKITIPQEKAKELVDSFLPFVDCQDIQDDCTNRGLAIINAKKCALKLADEILDNVMIWWELPCKDPYFIIQKTYWVNVKKEIQKL